MAIKKPTRRSVFSYYIVYSGSGISAVFAEFSGVLAVARWTRPFCVYRLCVLSRSELLIVPELLIHLNIRASAEEDVLEINEIAFKIMILHRVAAFGTVAFAELEIDLGKIRIIDGK